MELSKRLQAVADLVTDGYKTADIGTDHAYIPIYLLEHHIAPFAIAMDVNVGPLERARAHVREKHLEEKITLRLSDGFEALVPGEADTAILAGMGGGLVMKILKENWDVTLHLKECILQPQSEIAKVRAFLLKEGFLFLAEDMVLEDGKFYPMMKVKPPVRKGQQNIEVSGSGLSYAEEACGAGQKECPHRGWSDVEICYGRLLLEGKHPVLKQFLGKEIQLKTKILKNLEGQDSEHARQRMRELYQELSQAQKGMEYYAV